MYLWHIAWSLALPCLSLPAPLRITKWIVLAYPPPDRNQRFNPGGTYRPESDPVRPPFQPQMHNNRMSQSYGPPPVDQSTTGYSQAPPQHTYGGPQPPPNPAGSSHPPPNNFSHNLQRQQSRNSMPSTPTTPIDSDMPTGNTPGVIGAQEVYRDLRLRREAEHSTGPKGPGDVGDRLSFKDKMKMFAGEAGEGTPVQRPKSSKSQRALEESLSYGNGYM